MRNNSIYRISFYPPYIWNHYIQMEKIAENVTRYTDSIELHAGYLTQFAAWWALKFYKHRQKKWQEII